MLRQISPLALGPNHHLSQRFGFSNVSFVITASATLGQTGVHLADELQFFLCYAKTSAKSQCLLCGMQQLIKSAR